MMYFCKSFCLAATVFTLLYIFKGTFWNLFSLKITSILQMKKESRRKILSLCLVNWRQKGVFYNSSNDSGSTFWFFCCVVEWVGSWSLGTFPFSVGFPLRRKEKGTVPSRGRTSCAIQQAPPPAWPGRAVAEPGRKSWGGPKPISIVGSTGSIGTQVCGRKQ